MLSTDFTDIRYANGSRRAYMIAAVDPVSSWVPGWAVGPSPNRELALTAWHRVQESFEAADRPLAGVVVHQDQDAVFTSYDWLRSLLINDDVIVSYSENGAKGNPWIESFWSRFKEENASLIGTANSVPEQRELIGRQVGYYNRQRRHSGIDYRSPVEFLRAEGRLPGSLSRNWCSNRFKFSGQDRGGAAGLGHATGPAIGRGGVRKRRPAGDWGAIRRPGEDPPARPWDRGTRYPGGKSGPANGQCRSGGPPWTAARWYESPIGRFGSRSRAPGFPASSSWRAGDDRGRDGGGVGDPGARGADELPGAGGARGLDRLGGLCRRHAPAPGHAVIADAMVADVYAESTVTELAEAAGSTGVEPYRGELPETLEARIRA